MEFCFDKDADQIQAIYDCVKSDMGNFYQHQMAQKTEEHLYVPWINSNTVFRKWNKPKLALLVSQRL